MIAEPPLAFSESNYKQNIKISVFKMLELVDFSSLLQIVIAFYGVYAIANKNILNSFIFNTFHGSLIKLKEKSDEQLRKAQSQYDATQKFKSEIDNAKLSDTEKLHISTCMMGNKQVLETTTKLNEEFNDILKYYEGKSFFSVLSLDMIGLSVFLMVMGVLDYKTVWVTDDICFTLIIVVAILQFHCFLYEFSKRIRSIKYIKPTVIGHLLLMSLCVIGAFYIFECKNWTFGHCSDIKLYMSIFAILVVAPPIIILVRHYLLYKKLDIVLKDWGENMEWSMNFYHRNVNYYKERQTQVDSPGE